MSNDNTHTHPEDGKVYACPNCDSAPVSKRNPDKAIYCPGYVYYCPSCSTGHDNVVEREVRNNGGGKHAKHGLARKLEDMDPDEIGA